MILNNVLPLYFYFLFFVPLLAVCFGFIPSFLSMVLKDAEEALGITKQTTPLYKNLPDNKGLYRCHCGNKNCIKKNK